jgi:hypothetical protein
MRGGAQEPLTREDIEAKFRLNTAHGGWSAERTTAALKVVRGLYDGSIDLALLRRAD